MEQLNYAAIVGVVVVVLCTSEIAQPLRDRVRPHTKVLECCFCTSFWVSLLVNPSSTYFVTVLFSNVAVMLLHWSIATYQTQEDQT